MPIILPYLLNSSELTQYKLALKIDSNRTLLVVKSLYTRCDLSKNPVLHIYLFTASGFNYQLTLPL